MGDPTTAQAERGVGGKAEGRLSVTDDPNIKEATACALQFNQPFTMHIISNAHYQNAQCNLYQNAQR